MACIDFVLTLDIIIKLKAGNELENLGAFFFSFCSTAMSFPATGLETTYRNDLKDVAKMLKKKHQDNYLVCF